MSSNKVIKGVIKGGGNYAPSSTPSTSRIPPRPAAPQRPRQGGVISGNEYQARSKADEIIQQAHNEAQMIRSQAEEYRQKGYEDGYHQGLEEGKAQVTETILQLNQSSEERFKNFEPELVKLSVKIAEKVLGSQLQLQPELIIKIVGKALGAVRHQREIFLRVNPSDYELLSQHKTELLDFLSRAPDIDIRPDPNISPGGCRIESEIGTIEAALDQQLAAIEKILLG